MPEGVTEIAQEAFVYSRLESIILPSSLTSLNGYPLAGIWNLKKIDVSGDNPAYTSRDGVLYSKDMSMLIRCPMNKTGGLEIPEGVKTVERFAFRQCRGLESISIPASMEDIPESALFNSHDGIDICENLVSVSVAEGSRHFSSEDGVLYDKKKEKLLLCPSGKRRRLTVPATVQSIKSDLSHCRKLEFIDILSVNTKIDFRYPPALREIHIPENHTLYETVGDSIRDRKYPVKHRAYERRIRSFHIARVPEGIISISGDYIPFTVTEEKSFVDNLVDGLSHTKSDFDYNYWIGEEEILEVPASVIFLDTKNLAGRKHLKEINIVEGNCMYASRDGIVYSKDMSTLIFCPRGKAGELIVIPDGVTRIAAGSFSNIPLKRLVIPASVTTIDDGAFSSICFPVHLREGNPMFESRDGKICRRSGLKE